MNEIFLHRASLLLYVCSSHLYFHLPSSHLSHVIPALPIFSCPVGSKGKELYPLQDRGEYQEEGAGVRQGVQAQRRPAAAHRQQQEE